MRWWRSMGNWLPWSSRQRREEDLDREIRAHLELEAEEQQDSGLAAEEARYAAQRALGNATLVKEDVREMWGWSSLERLKQGGLRASKTPQVYEPFLQKPSNSFNVVLRAAGNPMHVAEAVRHEVLAIDKEQPVSNVRTMEELVARSVTQDRLSAFLLGLFAALALGLAAIGIYGVMAYLVTQRTHEIGIRIALGAHQRGILQLVLEQSLRMVLLGLGIGLAASLALTRVLGNLLYEVKPSDPLIFIAVFILLLDVALIAAFIPARRASRVDPMVALRYE